MQNGEDNIILRHNVVAEDLRRIGQEWVDGLITLFVVPLIGTINTLAPQALSTKFLFRYYEERTVQNAERDATFRAAKEAYAAKVHEAHNAWRGAQQSFSQS